MGECSEGMSGKAGIPQGPFRGLRGSVGSLHTMRGCAIVTETPPSTTATEGKRVRKREEREGKVQVRKLNLKEPSSPSRCS